MHHLKLIELIASNAWAMTTPAFRSILAVVDGENLDDKRASYLHSMNVEAKTEMVASFGERVEGSHFASRLGNVGILPVYGPTIPRANLFQKASGAASYDALIQDFKMLEADARVDTIITMFDTPGGAVTGNSDFADVIKSSSKLTLAYAWMAASAGYWAASAATEIIVAPTAIVGSIGTVMTLTDTSAADEKRGIKHHEIVSSQSPLKRGDGDEVNTSRQEMVDGLADVFIEAVAENRNTTVDNVKQNYGKGAVVVARKALEFGMVDGISGVDAFVNSLVDNKNTSTFFVTSAQADQTAEGNNMDQIAVLNEAPLTAEKLIELNPSAAEEIGKSAVNAEHARLKEIEAMGAAYEDQSPNVREAVRGVIDLRKYDMNASVGTLGADVFKAANEAQQLQLKALAAVHATGTEAAARVKATPEVLTQDPNAVDEKAVVAGLVAEMKGAN